MTTLGWFKRIDFYMCVIAYMFARLVGNCLMIYGPVFTTYFSDLTNNFDPIDVIFTQVQKNL